MQTVTPAESKHSSLQPKLLISHPTDTSEREANKTADQIMNMSNPAKSHTYSSTLTRAENLNISKKGLDTTQLQSTNEAVNEISKVRSSSGSPLDRSTRTFMEARFGENFAHVRIHTDGKAATSAKSIGALAYTVGNDIVFGEGQYNSSTIEGKRLIAHELTHVVQSNNAISSEMIHRQVATPPQQGVQAQQPAPDPALVEWNAHRRVHVYFDNFANYARLRPLYQQQHNIQNPAEYLDINTVQLTFFRRNTPGHRDLVGPLQNAETALRQQNFDPAINSFWALNPRLIAGSNALSNHSLGRAIDINPAGNPRIVNRDDIRVIRAVTNVDLGQAQEQPENALRQASQTFQNSFNQQWIDQQTQQLQQLQNNANPSRAERQEMRRLTQLIGSINRRRAALDGYARNGFLNLETQLIAALQNAGFRWGGAYQHSKDAMHFEM